MPMSAVCLRGKASRQGFRIVQREPRHASRSHPEVERVDCIWTENENIAYTLYSGTDEAEEALISALNAREQHQLGAFTSQYGHPPSSGRYDGGIYTAETDVFAMVDQLRLLHNTLASGGVSAINPPPSAMAMSPFSVGFHLWLAPAENSNGFSSMLLTWSLHCFLANEIVTKVMANSPLLVCANCKHFHQPKRRHAVYCSGKCRTMGCRMRQRSNLIANG
jgi:hypothetical protein